MTNALKTTTEDESLQETPSKNIAPEKNTNKVHGGRTTTEEEVANVQLSDEDLRIRLLSDDELSKEVVALMDAMRFDEANKLFKRHKELNKK